jgi:DnaJ-class molecular chaperone
MSEASSMDCRVGLPTPERTCEQGCNGCEDCTDYDDDTECERCRGDGRDPWNDYLLPCPACQGEQQP